MKKSMIITALALASGLTSGAATAARDYINIVGSSTVYPFSTVVAERFGRATQFKTPKVESTGSGGGLKLFCSGVGIQFPDIANASRRIKQSEVAMCNENGVTEIVEVLVGFDGIVIGNSTEAKQIQFTRKDLFLGLAKYVPNPDGSETTVENPYKNWSEVNPALPNRAIEVLGPPPTSGTRDAFVELVMEAGCDQIDWVADLSKKAKAAAKAGNSAKADELKNQHKTMCQTVREDGAFVETGENDNLIVQKLNASPDAFGVFGFSFLDQNIDVIQGSMIDGFAPTFESISDGSYPVSRPLYFYVKKAHVGVIPGIHEYIKEFTHERAFGEEGYLADKGMISLDRAARRQTSQDVSNLKLLQL
ncbi:substrate-binding domain-containing protein [Aestuariibacter salexigens]|uniref:substrate-binding domain-containing protein n=1 Tax=Aestuariibacter salexigens TaxID=226010 RepID=UPI0003F896C8|nr:substrate-binding domain-containing protein [Aestuariibacter salexigens]